MFETLFGSEMPLAARFFIAFLVVLGLIGATAWLVRRFGANRLGGAGARGRQPRLAVIDAATVDGRRRLVLIRRDNVEHLLMIGGPTDVVVEPNIVRAAGRDAVREPGRAATPELGGRQTPVVENAWPLQPLNEPAPASPSRPYRASATDEPWLAPEPGARPRPADSFGGVSADVAPRFTADLPAPAPRPGPAPRVSVAPAVAPPVAVEPPPAPQTDHNLAEMALQLEAALRRAPMPEGRPPVTDPLAVQASKPAEPRPPLREFKPRLEPKFEASKVERPNEPKLDIKPEPKFESKLDSKSESRLEAKPEPKSEPKQEPKLEPLSGKSLYDNLEEEMASLLGRPSGKS